MLRIVTERRLATASGARAVMRALALASALAVTSNSAAPAGFRAATLGGSPAPSVSSSAAPAPLPGAGLGEIRFPNSGAPAAQPEFVRGVLLLHSFEYDDAAAAFRAAERIDPGFAMAYWGEAMTYNHPLWHQQDRQAALAALARLAPSPAARQARARLAREKAWLAAVDTLYGEGDKADRDRRYAAAMERLSADNPEDLEAASLYALALLGTCEHGREVPVYMQAAAVAQKVFDRNPRHPGAVHYLIHSYDDPEHARLGLPAAQVYARIAPAAAHALHMPSHIFLALGMWDDVAASNEASWAASEARRVRLHLPLDERGYHAFSWLSYAYLQQGRLADSRRLVAQMAADAAASGSPRTREHLALMQAGYRIESRDWRADLGSLPDLDGIDPGIAAAARFAHGLAAQRSGDARIARQDLAALTSMGGQGAPDILRQELAAVLMLPAGSDRTTGGGARGGDIAGRAGTAGDAARQALAALARAAAEEDATSYEFGPPVVVKPVHELAGELLLDLGQPAAARRQFEQALARAPRRSLALLGLARAAARSGDAEASKAAYADLARSWQRADASLPLAEVRAGGSAVAPGQHALPGHRRAAALRRRPTPGVWDRGTGTVARRW